MSSEPAPGRPRSGRIDAIDSMRGVASLMVAGHHFGGALASDLAWAPAMARAILHEGALGVQIFFVLSGYVIALSTERLRPCWSNIGRFVVRRGTRLDPPYLVSIALAVGLLAVTNALEPATARPLPGTGQLLSHVVYLQNILGYGNIVVVYWSLCFEVQMYLLYILLFFLERRLAAGRPARHAVLARVVIWYPLLLASILVKYQIWPLETPGWCLPFWFLFFLGAQMRWLHNGAVRWREAAPGLALVAVLGIPAEPAESAAIAAGLATVFWHRRLAGIGSFRPLLFLGVLSYSIYLIHPIVGGRFVELLRRLVGGEFTTAGSVLVFLAGIALSVAAAWVVYLTVEKPTIALSRRVRLHRHSDPA